MKRSEIKQLDTTKCRQLANDEIESLYKVMLVKIKQYQEQFDQQPTISNEKIKVFRDYKKNTIDSNVTHTW